MNRAEVAVLVICVFIDTVVDGVVVGAVVVPVRDGVVPVGARAGCSVRESE